MSSLCGRFACPCIWLTHFFHFAWLIDDVYNWTKFQPHLQSYTRITFSSPSFDVFNLYCTNSDIESYSNDPSGKMLFQVNALVSGDLLVVCYHLPQNAILGQSYIEMFHLCFHTDFVEKHTSGRTGERATRVRLLLTQHKHLCFFELGPYLAVFFFPPLFLCCRHLAIPTLRNRQSLQIRTFWQSLAICLHAYLLTCVFVFSVGLFGATINWFELHFYH